MTDTTISQAVRGICTPAQHTQTHKTKPVILLALGVGPHGKTALLEYPEGWQRTIDLVTEFDGWHPLFSDLQPEERKRLREHVRPAFIAHKDGTQSRPDPLSFMRRVHTARGSIMKFTYFDVPLETYEDGAITGYRCAAKLLDALALGHGPHISIRKVLEEVAEAEKGEFYGTNRRAAAASFMEEVDGALRFFAKHSNHQSYLPKRIANAERYRDDAAERKAIERTEFVERMKAAKEAKRAVKSAQQ